MASNSGGFHRSAICKTVNEIECVQKRLKASLSLVYKPSFASLRKYGSDDKINKLPEMRTSKRVKNPTQTQRSPLIRISQRQWNVPIRNMMIRSKVGSTPFTRIRSSASPTEKFQVLLERNPSEKNKNISARGRTDPPSKCKPGSSWFRSVPTSNKLIKATKIR